MAFQRRLRILFLIAAASAVVIWLRLLELQVVERSTWVAEAQAKRLWIRDLSPPRGRILDAGGQVVAHDVPVPELAVVGSEWRRRARVRCEACGSIYYYDPSSARAERRTRPRHCTCGAPPGALVPLPPADLSPLETALGFPPGRLAELAQSRVAEVDRLTRDYRRALVAGGEYEFLIDDAVDQRRDDLLQRPVVIVSKVTDEVVRLLELDDVGRYRGFEIRYAEHRTYAPDGPPGQMLGYVSVVEGEEELEALRARYGDDVNLDTRRGRWGLERASDDALLGKHGAERLARDEAGAFTVVVGGSPPAAGKTLRLAMTSEACRQAEEAMRAEADREGYAPHASPSGGLSRSTWQRGASSRGRRSPDWSSATTWRASSIRPTRPRPTTRRSASGCPPRAMPPPRERAARPGRSACRSPRRSTSRASPRSPWSPAAR